MQQLQAWVTLHHSSGLCSLKWQVSINFSPWPLPCLHDWFLHWSVTIKLVSRFTGGRQKLGFGEVSCGFFNGLVWGGFFPFLAFPCLFVCLFLWWNSNKPHVCLKGFTGFLAAEGWESDRARAEHQETTSDTTLYPDTGQKEPLKQALGVS